MTIREGIELIGSDLFLGNAVELIKRIRFDLAPPQEQWLHVTDLKSDGIQYSPPFPQFSGTNSPKGVSDAVGAFRSDYFSNALL